MYNLNSPEGYIKGAKLTITLDNWGFSFWFLFLDVEATYSWSLKSFTSFIFTELNRVFTRYKTFQNLELRIWHPDLHHITHCALHILDLHCITHYALHCALHTLWITTWGWVRVKCITIGRSKLYTISFQNENSFLLMPTTMDTCMESNLPKGKDAEWTLHLGWERINGAPCNKDHFYDADVSKYNQVLT